MQAITAIPTAELNRMKKTLAEIKNYLEASEMINEQQACELLGISRSTLTNYMCNGRIPKDYYTVGVGGNKFFNKSKLMGLNAS